MAATLLIIEDDATIIDALEDTFQFHGFTVLTAPTGKDGYRLFKDQSPDLIILDVMLPDLDGFEVCKKIRGENRDIPVIMLTAKSQESDKLLGFERGADDYVTKPFSVKELLARVQAVLKRTGYKAGKSKKETTTVGSAEINLKNFTIIKDGATHPLSPKECEILKLFLAHPDEVIHRNRVIDVVWGDEYFPSPRTIDNFILKLRNKIEQDPRNPTHLLTVHGAGYKFIL
jgi:DNA-binding response OmpR family regulator